MNLFFKFYLFIHSEREKAQEHEPGRGKGRERERERERENLKQASHPAGSPVWGLISPHEIDHDLS